MRPRLLCALLLVAAPALAQPAGPPPVPMRDVAVLYRASGGTIQEFRMAWLAAEGKLRMETPGGALLHDTRSKRTTLLMTERRMFVEDVEDDRAPGIGLVPPGSRVARLGADRIAGLDCTLWRIEPPREDAEEEPSVTQACITADGVPLRIRQAEGSDQASDAVALKVDYARQDPAQFQVPLGYRPFDPKAATPKR
ncbi:hypothetical protein [Roseicella frigidaeris]|uniref:DUF4412 domain-containing protein n=1 Tax=Roseicella frigidaeris TaxID=2230885 RepID=A0A327M182_9PROT|nr:hypothetical protein [Roseicella frigidaeris]RAI56035.1 hypothetical protein DOO78_23145 [Roseicella frigidaeris]